jgi:sulfate transport system ATP-binding protein
VRLSLKDRKELEVGITAVNITKRFRAVGAGEKPFLAVDDVSFAVPKGHLVALLGPSGSGKSTVLRIIAGLEHPDSGEIRLEGVPVTDLPAKARGVGFVFQHYALFKHMTVWKNIAFGLEVNGRTRREIRERVEELLELVRLSGYEERYPSQLSGGQRQRVALARALAPRPRVLLLDEPFGALDAKVRRNLAAQLRTLHDEVRTTSVFVTHDQEEAIEIADEIVVVNRGRVEQIGTAEQVYDRPASKFVASFIGNVNVIEGFASGDAVRAGPRGMVLKNVKAPIPGGEVVLLVRPEDVEITDEASDGRMKAKITEVRYRGTHYETELDLGGIEIRSVWSKVRGRALGRRPGQEIYVRFARHTMFEAGEGHEALRAQLQSLGYIE